MRPGPSLLLLVIVALAAAASGGLPEGEDFGASFTLESPTPLAEILREPERFEGKAVLIRGTVSDVCQKKGCWTVIRDGGEHVRVRFRDYGFFLPKDCTGAEAWAEGHVTVDTLSESEARHYAAESRDGDPSRIHGPQREIGFTADAVRLVGRGAR